MLIQSFKIFNCPSLVSSATSLSSPWPPIIGCPWGQSLDPFLLYLCSPSVISSSLMYLLLTLKCMSGLEFSLELQIWMSHYLLFIFTMMSNIYFKVSISKPQFLLSTALYPLTHSNLFSFSIHISVDGNSTHTILGLKPGSDPQFFFLYTYIQSSWFCLWNGNYF